MTFKKLIVAASLLLAAAAAHAEQTLDISYATQQLDHSVRETGQWVKAHPKEAAEILGPLWGNIPPATVERANSRRSYDIIPVKVEHLAEQQRIADTYYAAKLIPKPLKVSAITVWTPKP